MKSSMTILNHQLPLDLYPGKIIHVDKYTDVQGGAFNVPVISTTYTDVVFRATGTDEDVRLTTKAKGLPLYSNKQIQLLASGRVALGFIDKENGRVYYTAQNPGRLLRLGISPLWTLVISLVCAAIPYLLYGSTQLQYCLLSFAVTWGLYFLQNLTVNYMIWREIRKKLLK